MLTHLRIHNFAIIDEVEIDLGPGLTVLTGETGAGKSIVVDALQLAAGGRAASDAIRPGAERAEVSATFDLSAAPPGLLALLDEQSVETDGELVVRRVVTREGKTRGYLNGLQVPIQVLREAGTSLVEIHGQHEFQTLAQAGAQRARLDAYGGHEALAAEVAQRHRDCAEAAARLAALESAALDRDARLDLLRYQVRELRALALQPGEATALLQERARHAHRERLAAAARQALALAYDDDGNAHAALSRAASPLRAAGAIDERLAPLAAALQDAAAAVAGTARELSAYLEDLEVDPGRQEEVEQRLAAIEGASRKHRVEPDELPARMGALESELSQLENTEQSLVALRRDVGQLREAWREAAMRLSSARRAAASRLGEAIGARMQSLGMAGGRFEIAVEPRAVGTTAPTHAHGLDEVEFRVTANPGLPPQPVGRVASGGELSRLSLAVQVTCAGSPARSTGAPGTAACMVFDEVDAGVGGGVAEIVGRELAALGAASQVVCVTHLAQVAAQASHHLRVVKITDGRTTRTQIRSLQGDERREEIARMLGGLSVTDKAREHASEMLAAARGLSREPAGSGSRSGGSDRRAPARGRGSRSRGA